MTHRQLPCLYDKSGTHQSRLDQNFLKDLLLTMHHMPKTPYALFSTSTCVDSVSFLSFAEPSPSLKTAIQRIKANPYDPLVRDSSKGSLVKYSLLSITDDFSYTGREFEHRKVCTPKVVECIFEGETFSFEVFSYECAYMSSLKQGASSLSVAKDSLGPILSESTLRMSN